MFEIDYITWSTICSMYFSISKNSQKVYLQWFPFSKLSEEDKETMLSEEFYHKYIERGSFVVFSKAMHRSENYIQKGDGSFRDSTLLSPICYLILQCIGKIISNAYISQRSNNVVCYYAGNYDEMRPKYKLDYDRYVKTINEESEGYQYYIKTDVSNFFGSIVIDKLIKRIDTICNSNEVKISQLQLSIYKEFIQYCGNGKFPLVENSLASSYLASIVYMDDIDCRLEQFIKEKIPQILSFKAIRYVDDMYILFNCSSSKDRVKHLYNQIRNEYSSILKDYGLALNTKKCKLGETWQISDDLKNSLYDENVYGIQHGLEEFYPNTLYEFLCELEDKLSVSAIDIEEYNELIEKKFTVEGIKLTPSEVYNYFIYESDDVKSSADIANKLQGMIYRNSSFIELDPKRLTVLIMRTKGNIAIKALLNNAFNKNRAGLWNSYNTTIAISYLIQSEFRHIDLLEVLGDNCPELKTFYNFACRNSFLRIFDNNRFQNYIEIIGDDWKANYLYLMYWIESAKYNSFSSFAYFKNFFDRFTADMAFAAEYESNLKRPNYKLFYKENEFKKIYKGIDNVDDIISKAHKYRNSNPISHSSAELISTGISSEDLKRTIDQLWSLVDSYIVENIT